MTAAIDTGQFDAEAYWSRREFKKWVVHLSYRGRHDRKFVRARTAEGAIRTARAHSRLPRRAYAEALLATPALLGCVPTSSVQPYQHQPESP